MNYSWYLRKAVSNISLSFLFINGEILVPSNIILSFYDEMFHPFSIFNIFFKNIMTWIFYILSVKITKPFFFYRFLWGPRTPWRSCQRRKLFIEQKREYLGCFFLRQRRDCEIFFMSKMEHVNCVVSDLVRKLQTPLLLKPINLSFALFPTCVGITLL